MKNPHLDVDKLSLIAAFLILLYNIISLLLAFQTFMDKVDNNRRSYLLNAEKYINNPYL
ncbi:MAG: hypothetical protein GX187_03280 [Clostridiaceae bacterium]|nr:hypothetical protein [Clostridiaceae bacterium]